MQLLWGFVNSVQLIIHTSLFNFQFGAISLFVNSMLIEMVNIERMLPFNDDITAWVPDLESRRAELTENLAFQYLEYNLSECVGNLIVFYGIVVVFLIFIIIAKLISKNCRGGKKTNKCRNWFRTSGTKNLIIRTVIETYFDAAMSSAI